MACGMLNTYPRSLLKVSIKKCKFIKYNIASGLSDTCLEVFESCQCPMCHPARHNLTCVRHVHAAQQEYPCFIDLTLSLNI